MLQVNKHEPTDSEKNALSQIDQIKIAISEGKEKWAFRKVMIALEEMEMADANEGDLKEDESAQDRKNDICNKSLLSNASEDLIAE